MLKVNDLLNKTNKTVSSVAGICLGLAVISITAAVIKDNVNHLFPRKKKKIGISVVALGEAEKEESSEPDEPEIYVDGHRLVKQPEVKKHSSKKEKVTGETGDIQEPAK